MKERGTVHDIKTHASSSLHVSLCNQCGFVLMTILIYSFVIFIAKECIIYLFIGKDMAGCAFCCPHFFLTGSMRESLEGETTKGMIKIIIMKHSVSRMN